MPKRRKMSCLLSECKTFAFRRHYKKNEKTSHMLAKSVCKTHMPASRIYKELSNSTKWKQTDQLKNGQKIWTLY